VDWWCGGVCVSESNQLLEIMKNIVKDVFNKVQFTETAKQITDKGFEKLVASAVGATLLDLGTIFGLFIGLEVIDIITRMMAEAAKLYMDTYDEKIVKKRGSLLTYIKMIPSAHRWRRIDSTALRDGFWSKTIVYFILIFAGFMGDQILRVNHIPPFVLLIFCMILVCTETLSILENLGECGVSSVHDIKALIQKRKDNFKG